MAKRKEELPKQKPNAYEAFLRNLSAEDYAHDDHGPVIVGRRDRKPKIPNTDKTEK